MIKLVCVDVDGTLCESRKQADNEMIDLLLRIKNKYHLALFSGADKKRIMWQVGDHIKHKAFFVGEYSASHILFGCKISIYTRKLNENDKNKIRESINLIRDEKSMSVLDISDYQATYYLVPPTSPDKIRNEIDPNGDLRRLLIKQLKFYLPNFEIRIGGKTSIDIQNKGISKKNGVDKLTKFLNLKPEEVVFIGDRCFEGGNDWMENCYKSYNVKSIEETKTILRDLIKQKKKKVCVSGYFNPIHKGHLEMFEAAKKLGDELIVIVNSDEQVKLKGSIPFMTEEERKFIIERIGCVDKVYISKDKDKTVCETLKSLKPNIFANGGDRFSDNVPEKKVCEELGIQMIFNIGGEKTQSSSSLIENAIKFKK